MKTRDIILYSVLFMVAVLLTSDVVSYHLTGNHIFSRNISDSGVLAGDDHLNTKCSNDPIIKRSSTNDPQLKAIPEYEKACKASFIKDMMIFTNMPVSSANANQAASKMAKRLEDFKKQGIKPIVIMEPDSEWGLVDFHEYATGYYDKWMGDYFKDLKNFGVTDSMMGLWIPFPEPQQPYWNNNGDPDDFSNSANRYFRELRAVFPEAKTGVLLDSQVGETDKASQVLAYTRLLDNSLVDVAGLQGFPWHASDESDSRAPVVSANDFMPAYLIEEVADSLNTKEVLLNTGTYRHKKTENGGDIAVTTDERRATLKSISHVASVVESNNYNVTVNVFAENKIDQKEGVDWSYWESGKYKSSHQTQLFIGFIKDLMDKNVAVSIYDSRS